MRKVHGHLRASKVAAVERSMPQPSSIPLLQPHSQSVDEDLDDAAQVWVSVCFSSCHSSLCMPCMWHADWRCSPPCCILQMGGTGNKVYCYVQLLLSSRKAAIWHVPSRPGIALAYSCTCSSLVHLHLQGRSCQAGPGTRHLIMLHCLDPTIV